MTTLATGAFTSSDPAKQNMANIFLLASGYYPGANLMASVAVLFSMFPRQLFTTADPASIADGVSW